MHGGKCRHYEDHTSHGCKVVASLQLQCPAGLELLVATPPTDEEVMESSLTKVSPSTKDFFQ